LAFTDTLKKYFLPALLIVALLVALLKPATDNLRTVASRLQSQLNNLEEEFYRDVHNTELRKALASGEEEAAAIEKTEERGLWLYYYKDGNLQHWTNNAAIPALNPGSIDEGTTFAKLKNGWYQISKYTDTVTNETIIGLVEVKNDFPFENKFLKNDFVAGVKVPHNIALNDHNLQGSVQVSNLNGQFLFSIYTLGDVKEVDINYLLLAAQLTLLLLLFYYIHFGAKWLTTNKGFLPGISFLLLAIVLVRGLMLWFDQPAEFYKLDIFDPRYYGSSQVTKSLGDLIINAILLTWVVIFYTLHHTLPQQYLKLNRNVRVQNVALIFCCTWLVWWVFKTLVLDSTISFEVYNILSLDSYSAVGLICIALLLVCHFLITRNIFTGLQNAGVERKWILAVAVAYGIIFGAAVPGSAYTESLAFSVLWSAGFIVIVYIVMLRDKSLAVRNIIIYVALYSILATFLIENLYEQKERNQRRFFSGKLITERDFVAEYLFEDIARRIAQDGFIRNYFGNPLLSKKVITDRVNSLYLGGYFNKYNLKLLTFDAAGKPLRNEDTLPLAYYHSLLNGDTAPQRSLYYINDTSLNYSYLSFINFETDSGKLGTFAMRLTPKVYYGQNVYPELLLGSNLTVSNNTNNYAYAIYQNNKLIAQYGDFSYSYYWNQAYDFGGSDFKFIEEDDWEHSIQRFTNGKQVIVSVPREPVFEPVATFSYLFSFLFMCVVVLLLGYRLLNSATFGQVIPEGFALSFRTRINYSMLAMIVVSFIIIGIITISFFSRQYDNFYTDRLLRKEKVVHASLEYFIQRSVGSGSIANAGDELDYEIARLADINSVDINLFDRDGNLLVASQPIIYDKGLVSKKMNPDAYFELENNRTAQVTEQERIGDLKYLATYAPVRNSRGEAVAYIGIPYFERSKNIDDEVSSFLVALMNVYVFLLICAAVLAYFISNSITRSLTIISEKLRILNLNKINEPIEWNSRDEIGILVSEYNKMIAELEQSAQKLAKGERESAWREMAKQIAHEIKNPLTPMKLSIQYLQRAIDEGNPNIEQLAKKVARTLEEQIENLSSIATAFSSFAKMPKAQNEIINLNELLKSITDLFAREENVSVTFTTSSDSPLVFADKNQLVSVFNNLVKNAIQSIPEQRKGFVDVHIKDEDGWVTVTVSDNGSGIPSDNYDKVFVPNFTTKSSGTGLGLAITKQIIDGNGGRIWFESAENVGTAFFVRMKQYEG
jgi:signal transduction histidine kinase